MRPSAATQLYLETGGNLRKVQQFLQHACTVDNSQISAQQHYRALPCAGDQEKHGKDVERITVIPEKRAPGVGRLNLPRMQARKIATGRFDPAVGVVATPTSNT